MQHSNRQYHMIPHSVTHNVGRDTLQSAVTISNEVRLRALLSSYIVKGYELVANYNKDVL